MSSKARRLARVILLVGDEEIRLVCRAVATRFGNVLAITASSSLVKSFMVFSDAGICRERWHSSKQFAQVGFQRRGVTIHGFA